MRIIAHLDMDAFFAAIEERDNPRFSGFPIVVGADPKNGVGRGVVSTANYEARKYGIHSAMPISMAWRLAKIGERKDGKKTIFRPVNGAHYHEVSQKIMQILRKHVSLIEQTSIDEAYLDLITNTSDRLYLLQKDLGKKDDQKNDYQKAIILIKHIKDEIKEKEMLTASVGIGPNKLIAKMASARFKPDGLTIITPDQLQQFLDPLPVGDLPGVGPKTEEKLHHLNIKIIKDLKNLSAEKLVSLFGKWGEDIYKKARGEDDSPLELARLAKSISEQETFEVDTLKATFLLERLQTIARRVLDRMKPEGISSFRTVTLTVRFADFQTKNRSHSLSQPTSNFPILQKESFRLFLPFLDRRENPHLKPIRLLGVGIENFGRLLSKEKRDEPARQISLSLQ